MPPCNYLGLALPDLVFFFSLARRVFLTFFKPKNERFLEPSQKIRLVNIWDGPVLLISFVSSCGCATLAQNRAILMRILWGCFWIVTLKITKAPKFDDDSIVLSHGAPPGCPYGASIALPWHPYSTPMAPPWQFCGGPPCQLDLYMVPATLVWLLWGFSREIQIDVAAHYGVRVCIALLHVISRADDICPSHKLKQTFNSWLHGHETDGWDCFKCQRDGPFETNLSI